MKARLHASITTEEWDAREEAWLYGPEHVALLLSLTTDAQSGEDGAAEPTIQRIPVTQALGRTPTLRELPGVVVSVEDDDAWDAWYGNDAPALRNNRLEFGAWSKQGIQVRWTAECDVARVALDGVAEFCGVAIKVKMDEDVQPLVEALWGKGALSDFIVSAGEWRDLGQDYEENDRRHWRDYVLTLR